MTMSKGRAARPAPQKNEKIQKPHLRWGSEKWVEKRSVRYMERTRE